MLRSDVRHSRTDAVIMATYIVTSNRLNGLQRGDIVQSSDLADVDIQHLVDAGHLSPHTLKKPAKTKIIETKD